jgi:hypothetical protein
LRFWWSISALDLEVCLSSRSDGWALAQSRFADSGDALHQRARSVDAHFICEHALYVALPYRNAGYVQVAARN